MKIQNEYRYIQTKLRFFWFHEGNHCLPSQLNLFPQDLFLTLTFQGRIAYEAIGVYPARSFFGVDGVDGTIRIISSLKGDGLYLTTYIVSY